MELDVAVLDLIADLEIALPRVQDFLDSLLDTYKMGNGTDNTDDSSIEIPHSTTTRCDEVEEACIGHSEAQVEIPSLEIRFARLKNTKPTHGGGLSFTKISNMSAKAQMSQLLGPEAGTGGRMLETAKEYPWNRAPRTAIHTEVNTARIKAHLAELGDADIRTHLLEHWRKRAYLVQSDAWLAGSEQDMSQVEWDVACKESLERRLERIRRIQARVAMWNFTGLSSHDFAWLTRPVVASRD